MNTPLTDNLASAIAAAAAAEQAWLDDETDASDGCSVAHGTACQHPTVLTMRAADAAVDAARQALRDSDEPRAWGLTEDDQHLYDTVMAPSAEAALAIARANVSEGNYDFHSTLWVDVRVTCEATEEEATDTVQLQQQRAPFCKPRHKHSWSPDKEKGGLDENPGVFGHGGGVLIYEVCSHCGMRKCTDTWAQRPDTGEEGFTTVTYLDPCDDDDDE